MERLSKTAVKELLGRMPESTWQQWLAFGLLDPPGPDQRWDADEVQARVRAARSLVSEARALPRRALHLQRAGYPVRAEGRRAAVLEILHRVRPAARKMRQVRRELDALARRASLVSPPRRPRSYGIGLPLDDWIRSVELVDTTTFDEQYATAARWAENMPAIAKSVAVRTEVELTFDERVALLLVNLLIQGVPQVRKTLGLPPRPVGGPSIKH